VILRPITFSDIAGWNEDAHDAAFAAFVAGARLIVETPPKTRGLGVDGSALQRLARATLDLGPRNAQDARGFFERHFVPHGIEAGGFVTGYYEPEVAASLEQSERFGVPLYRRPPDLVEVAEVGRPPGWDPDMRFARASKHGLVPYFDRAAIEEGALAGRGLELAWLEDAVDAFFIHVQGSARLRLADGTTLRIAFDGKSGHAYTSIGRLAVERGLLAREAAHKDGLEAWLKRHKEEGRALMRENRSFIFFRSTGQDDGAGPFGAAGVPLIAGRSLAVDRTLHTCHTPIWVNAPALDDPEHSDRRFRRLMVAHDTGSAILGPARGDIFVGSGAAAGSVAGRIRHDATMVALVPVGHPEPT
jgi:membrane-bound lytic murein transglycosylase A